MKTWLRTRLQGGIVFFTAPVYVLPVHLPVVVDEGDIMAALVDHLAEVIKCTKAITKQDPQNRGSSLTE